MLDLTKHAWIYNENSQGDVREINVIAWETDGHAVCMAKGIEQPLLIDLGSHRVLNGDYSGWLASNDVRWAGITK